METRALLLTAAATFFFIQLCLCRDVFPFPADGDPFLLDLEEPAQRKSEEGASFDSMRIENDPCSTTVCGRGRECQLSALGEAVCVCRRPCERRGRPACGSDGRYYASHCELHRAACLEGRQVVVDRRDACLKNKDVERVGFESTSTHIPPASSFQHRPSTSSTPELDSSTQRECSHEEYDFMKENLLLYNNARLMDAKRKKSNGNEYLVSVLFSHYDQNNNGRLEAEELWQAAERDHLGRLSAHCILADMLLFDDPDADGTLDINEFYTAFSVSVVSLDKALEVNHVTARVGDNVEIKCDVRGTPPPPIVWRRNDMDLSVLNDQEIKVSQVFVDGSLYLTNVQLVHAGNYTCHAQRNKDVTQTHVLHVQTLPEVRVVPKLQSRAPGELAEMECRATGVPQPRVYWLKNDEELRMGSEKYTIIGNSTSLLVGKITYSDTGAYMCVASNPAGTTRDISSLVVQDQPPARGSTPPAPSHRLFAFHSRGLSVYEPHNCRLVHQVQSTDVIPGTQEYVCGDRGSGRNCSWGRALDVANRYVYVSQPERDRVLVFSRVQMVVVDVVVTDKYPVELHYVPNLDQVWVVCWRGTKEEAGTKTIQIIRDASQKKKHHTVHPEPVDGHFDLVSGLFVPSPQDLGHGWKYGYVVHTNQRGMYKLDLQAMKYLKTVDLTPYNCAPKSADFASFGGLVILECLEPVTGRPTGQIVLDYLTDTVLVHSTTLFGRPRVSPDSRRVVTLEEDGHSVVIVAQEITEAGLRFLFDVKTTLQIGDVAFFPSRTTHGYDLYAASASKEDVLFVDLADGKVEMITGVGRPHVAGRPLVGAGAFGRYLATTAEGALFVLNGATRTVNCEIGSIDGGATLVWVRAP